MSTPVTEMLHDQANGLDARAPVEIARALAEAQTQAAASVSGALDAICKASSSMAQTLSAGGRLYYVAAGSSGLMAAADALELGGTFGISPSSIRILFAGGMPRGSQMPGDVEDEVAELTAQLADLTAKDTVIAVSASGTTPYTLAALEIAQSKGAVVVGIANNSGSPLLVKADRPVHLATPPELIAGSTRMGAGTAQKIALNMMSTLMAVELGHIHDGMMVNLVADNAKLRGRAVGIVQAISGADEIGAADALEATNGRVKPAVLVAAGANPGTAEDLIERTEGNLRAALTQL